ncbi:MAG: hypothetical protein K2Q06_03070, partial [Parvularculaceae bacterium]|nr:hypothetical protein [Parvularculaceae bacterium]
MSGDAIVIGASGGIGRAFVASLEAEPGRGRIFALSRRQSGLDIRSEEEVAGAAAALAREGAEPDLVLIATG